MALEVGAPAPDFALRDQHLREVRLDALRGRPVLVVFFPFAFTGVCTREMTELQEHLDELRETGAEVLAVSCDPPATQRVFAEREGLDFPLLSDFWPHGAAARAYGVFNETLGAAVRGSFVVDADGVVRWTVVNDLPDARDVDGYRAALGAL